ncbi:MAG: hypothetical protein HWE07_09135 [Cytophagia bacterium]|nr:hypothetical protein [Cytophagia bacterium]
MIGIKLTTGFLKLYPSTSIELIKNNPLMAEDGKIPGTYTITIKVPNDADGYNARLLGAVNMVENYEAIINSEQTATLFFEGVPIERGLIIIKPGDDATNFNIDFVGGLRAVSRDIKDKKISEMSWADVALHAIGFGTGSSAEVATTELMQTAQTAAVSAVNAARAAGHFCLHRYENKGLTEEPDFEGFVNHVNPAGQGVLQNGIFISKQFKFITGVNESANGGLELLSSGHISITVNSTTYSSTTANTSIMEKYKELANIVNAAESPTGIKLTAVVDRANYYINSGNLTQNGENGHLLIELTNGVDADVDLTAFTTVESDSNWQEIENSEITRYSNPYHYCPSFRFNQVFSKIEEDYNVKFAGAFFNDADLITAAFHTNTSMMVPVKIGDSPVEGEFYAFRQTFNTGDYLPEWTIGQWIREVALLFCCGVIYDQYSRVIKFTYLSDVIEAANYYDAKAQGIKFAKGVPDLSAYSGITFKYKGTKTTVQNQYTTNIVTIGSGEKEYLSSFQVISPYFSTDEDVKDEPIIFFDRGINGSGQFFAWQETASTNYNLEIAALGGNGIYEKFHKAWFRFLTTRKTLPVTALMELRHINQLNFSEKQLYDRVKYMVASAKIRLTMHGIDRTDLTLYST